MLDLGTRAPDVNVSTHTGYEGPLHHFWEQGPVILFFYPKDETHVCTKEVCLIQSELESFAAFDAQVLGASTDDIESHKKFASKHGLTFPLIADHKGQLAKQYEAFRSLLRVSKRMTYVIGGDGEILGRVHHEFSLKPHVEMIRQTLANLAT